MRDRRPDNGRPERLVLRAGRPERQRQIDDVAVGRRTRAPRQRTDRGLRHRRRDRRAGGAAPRSASCSTRCSCSNGSPPTSSSPRSVSCAGSSPMSFATGPTSCSPCSSSPTTPTARSPATATACARRPRSRPPCSIAPACSCSTSRSRASTRSRRARCGRCSTDSASGGGTVVLSSHVMDLVERLCDHVGVIHRGQLVATGPTDTLRNGRRLEDAFIDVIGATDGRRPGAGVAAADPQLRHPALATPARLAAGQGDPRRSVSIRQHRRLRSRSVWASGWRWPRPGRSVADDENLFVIFCVVVAFAILGFSVVAGVTQPIDPRVIAAEPLSDRDRAIGLLASAASGPPGLSGVPDRDRSRRRRDPRRGVAADRRAAVLAWLLTLLLLARTATNALGLLSNRFPRTGQIIVGLSGLVFYGAFQFVPLVLGNLDRGDRDQIAAGVRLQPGRPTRPGARRRRRVDGAAAGHLALGALWLPILAAAFQSTTHALTVSARAVRVGSGDDGADRRRASTLRSFVRRACGSGGVGAIAWRSLLTRFRTPRTALETFTGAGVGLAAVLVPTLLARRARRWRRARRRRDPARRAVHVGQQLRSATVRHSPTSSLAGAGPRRSPAARRARSPSSPRPSS